MDEWGPWIEHDGKGCPDLAGYLLQCKVERDMDLPETRPEDCDRELSRPWLWALMPWPYRVVAYRIRRPKALQQLREIAENPPRVREVVS